MHLCVCRPTALVSEIKSGSQHQGRNTVRQVASDPLGEDCLFLWLKQQTCLKDCCKTFQGQKAVGSVHRRCLVSGVEVHRVRFVSHSTLKTGTKGAGSKLHMRQRVFDMTICDLRCTHLCGAQMMIFAEMTP